MFKLNKADVRAV